MNRIFLSLFLVFLLPTASACFIVSPLEISQTQGNVPIPITFTADLTTFTYTLSSDSPDDITIEIRGSIYQISGGRSIQSGELITTIPSDTINLLPPATSSLTIKANIPPDLDQVVKVEVILTSGDCTSTILVIVDPEVDELPWFEKEFYSGEFLGKNITLTWFTALLLFTIILLIKSFLPKTK